MVKIANGFLPVSLVLIGWIAFALGIANTDVSTYVRLLLLSVARVLP